MRLIERFASSPEPVRADAYADGGVMALFPRLERAAINQLSGGDATLSRYGIWANTVRDHIGEALNRLACGDTDSARQLLIQAHNALSAFSAVQGRLDDGRSQ